MEEKANKFLEEEKLGTLMKKYSVPCIISLLVAALYNIVDQIFIANASYLGSYGNAANNAVFPLTIVALSLAVMIGDGCCAYVSILLGKNEKENAHKSIGCAIVLVIVIGLILTALYAIFQDPILTFFGARVNEGTFSNAKEYFTFITIGIPVYMFGQCLNPIIRSDGSPRFAMASTVLGAVFNIIFDPICIYGLHWGMMGAAVATVGGQVLTAVLAIWYLFHMKAVKLEKKSFSVYPGLMRQFLPLGITSFLSQISIVASMAAVNNMVVKYGATDAVFGLEEYSQIPMAVLGIVMKFFQIVISIAVGLSAGCIPVIGYNVGARRNDRALSLFKMILIAELVTGFAALFIVEVFPLQLIGIFGAANESAYYSEFAVKTFRIYLCMLPLATMNKGTFICMQSLGKAALSSILSLIREVVFGVGWALILPVFFGLDGVLYSMPLSDLLTAVIAVVMIRRIFQMLKKE
ncbi:MAG: MATE family efflux transporter [Lachnospiraceae bacterium]|nr:MATE family efflux transporter [Lachnospiraceae bacterium]